MAFQYPQSGPNNVAEYMASGLPWTTASSFNASAYRLDFPYVTNFVAVSTTTGSLRIGFTQNGVNGTNYFLVAPANGFFSIPVRCNTIFVRADTTACSASIVVGLTTIPQRNFPTLTGSGTYLTSSNSASLPQNVFGYGVPGDPGFGTGLG